MGLIVASIWRDFRHKAHFCQFINKILSKKKTILDLEDLIHVFGGFTNIQNLKTGYTNSFTTVRSYPQHAERTRSEIAKDREVWKKNEHAFCPAAGSETGCTYKKPFYWKYSMSIHAMYLCLGPQYT